MLRSRLLVTTLVAATGLTLTNPTPGLADATSATASPGSSAPSKSIVTAPPGSDKTTPAQRAQMQSQATLSKAADRIKAAIDAGHFPGLGSMQLTPTGLTINWHGTMPATLRERVESLRQGVQITIAPARYSETQLRAARDSIAARMAINLTGPVHEVGVAPDASGLILHVRPASRTASAAAINSTVAETLASAGGIAATVVTDEPAHYTSRLADNPPFWGGAKIGACTSGFGVHSTVDSRQYILTAAHCFRGVGTTVNTPANVTVGVVTHFNIGLDIAMVETSHTGGSGGRIYDGGVGVGEFSKGVTGFAGVQYGESVCVSGSTTGATCGYINIDTAAAGIFCDANGNNCNFVSDLIKAASPRCLGFGDSGAPVFTLVGSSHVTAKGTLTGTSQDCSSIYYQDFVTANQVFKIVPWVDAG